MNEQLHIWEPIASSEGLYCLYRLCDNSQGLELILIHDEIRSRKMHVLFENPVYAYKSTNETLVFGAISDRYGSLLEKGGSFFTIENSYKFRYFLFITSDEVTEVIAHSEPKVSWIMYDLPQPSRNEEDE